MIINRKTIIIIALLAITLYLLPVVAAQSSTINNGANSLSSLGSITGLVYNDSNHNGKYDPGEQGLAGWNIVLTNSKGSSTVATSVINGSFKFTNLEPGVYTISEVQWTGYTNTSPLSMNATLMPGQVLNVTTTYGLFGNARLGSIIGLVYNDLNHNGKYDAGEPGLAGWNLVLTNSKGSSTVATSVINGSFTFNNMKPGNYTIYEVQWGGYTNTSPLSMNVTLALGQNLNVTTTYGLFGNARLGSITGLVYNDLNDNGIYEPGDPGLVDWIIVLDNSKGFVADTVSGSNGSFAFNNVNSGNYTINEVQKSGYTNTSPLSLKVSLALGQNLNLTTAYGLFGNVRPGSIANPQNGSIEGQVINAAADNGVANVTIQVYFASCGLASQVKTNSTGFYEVSLAQGSYIVNETVPAGFTSTTPTSVETTVTSGKETTVNFGLKSATKLAYVANVGSNTVSVINTATNTVVTSIPVGGGPCGVAFSPDGTKAYVVNLYSNNVSVINTATNTVVTSIPVGGGPWNVAFSPNGNTAYVINSGSNNVSVINTATNTVVATIPVESEPMGVAVTPNGNTVYVANSRSNNMSVINANTNKVIANITVGTYSFDVAVAPNGLRAYVTNGFGIVLVINTNTNKVIANITIGTGTGPVGVVVSPNGSTVYVTDLLNNTVSVINTFTNTVVATIPVGDYPYDVAVTPNGNTVYVTNWFDQYPYGNDVSVINTATNTVVATIPVGRNPIGIAVNPDP
jgi:YVTN family beta-propeller protein